MITHYLKIAWRNLWKYKLQTAVGISGLAACLLGFGLCLYVCRTMWAIDHCFPNRERIAEIALTSGTLPVDVSGIPMETISLLRAMNCRGAEAFTYVAYPLDRSFQVETEQGTMLPFDPMLCLEADTCFRHVFGADILAGSWQRATQTPNAVVLSATTARRIFGENVANAVGKRLVTTAKLPYSDRRGGVAYTVQAVMADIPVNNSVSYMQHIDMLVLNDSNGRLRHTQEGLTGGMGYVLLREDGGWQTLTDDIRAKGLVQHLFGQNLDIELRPLGHAYREYGSSTKYVVWVAFTIGTLVLLAGLLNFFYFQIVTFLHRSREYSLRQVFGGRATDLLWQLFTQAALTVVLAFLLLFALLELGAPLLQDSLKGIVLVEMAQLRMQCAEYLGLGAGLQFRRVWTDCVARAAARNPDGHPRQRRRARQAPGAQPCAVRAVLHLLALPDPDRGALPPGRQDDLRTARHVVAQGKEPHPEHIPRLPLPATSRKAVARQTHEAARRRGRLPAGRRSLHARLVGQRALHHSGIPPELPMG